MGNTTVCELTRSSNSSCVCPGHVLQSMGKCCCQDWWPLHCPQGIASPVKACKRKSVLCSILMKLGNKWETLHFISSRDYDCTFMLLYLSRILSSLKAPIHSLSSHASLQTVFNHKKVSIFVLLHYWTLWIFPRPTHSENTFLPYATVWENILVCSRLLLFIIHYNII